MGVCKAMIKTKRIDSKTLQLTCFIVITCDEKALARYLKKIYTKSRCIKNDEVDNLVIEDVKFCMENDGACFGNMVYLPNPDEGALLHELTHLIFEMFEMKGIPINNDNQEIFAYTLEYFFTEGQKFLNKIKKGFKDER